MLTFPPINLYSLPRMKPKMIVFPNLPLNTKHIYAHAVDKSGCKIYVPGDSVEAVKITRDELQKFLDNQDPPLDTPIPPLITA